MIRFLAAILSLIVVGALFAQTPETQKIILAGKKAPIYFDNKPVGYVYAGAELFILAEKEDSYRVRVWNGKSEFFGWIKKSDIGGAKESPPVAEGEAPEVKLSKDKTASEIISILKVPYRTRLEGTKVYNNRAAVKTPVKTEKIYKKYPIAEKGKADGYGDFTIYCGWRGIDGFGFILDEKINVLENFSQKAHASYFWAIKEYISALKELRDNKEGNFRHLFQSAEKRRKDLG